MRPSILHLTLLLPTTNAISLWQVRDKVSSLLPRSMAVEVEERSGGSGSCPAVWTNIVSDLTAMFLDKSVNPSQCNDDARAAIRAAFHDCGTWDTTQGSTGGCDGSLILAREAYNLPENNGLQDISTKLLALTKKYNTTSSPVTVADVIQMASSVAIVACPGGPQVKTFVGRKDSSVQNPGGRLPDVKASADSLYTLFQNKGFSASELAALLGAHSTSKALAQADIPTGTPQDSTPGIWDVAYYAQTTNPPAGVVPFASDVALANHSVVGKEFQGMVGNAGKWTSAFANAMGKMALLGVPGGKNNLVDCTGIVPKATGSKREMRAADIFGYRH